MSPTHVKLAIGAAALLLLWWYARPSSPQGKVTVVGGTCVGAGCAGTNMGEGTTTCADPGDAPCPGNPSFCCPKETVVDPAPGSDGPVIAPGMSSRDVGGAPLVSSDTNTVNRYA